MKKRILFFDYWMKGFHNISALTEYLNEDYELFLLHLSSLQGIREDKKQTKNGVTCYDISHFNSDNLRFALKEIKPNTIITFNTTYIFDRAICIEARRAGIKLIFLQHGTRKTIKKESINHIKGRNLFKLFNPQAIIKNFHFIKHYFRSKDKDALELISFITVVFEFLFLPKKYKFFPSYPNECLADYCCIYSIAEKPYYLELGYKENEIVVTGNPKFKKRKPFNHPKPYVLFIDEGLPEAGNYYNVTTEKREVVLKRISDALKKIDIDLLVKPHPLAKETYFSEKGYKVINEDLSSLISGSEGCICHVSTAGDHVVLENKILISLSDAEYSSVPTPFIDSGIAVSTSSSEMINFRKLRLPDSAKDYRLINAKEFDKAAFFSLI